LDLSRNQPTHLSGYSATVYDLLFGDASFINGSLDRMGYYKGLFLRWLYLLNLLLLLI